jgi:hypothetical protein
LPFTLDGLGHPQYFFQVYATENGTTLLALKVIMCVFSRLEQLNCSLQGEKDTLSGMVQAVECTELYQLCSEDEFCSIMSDVSSSVVEESDLNPGVVPRIRRPPRRICGPAEVHIPQSAEELYRAMYYEVIDSALNQLKDRFNMDSPGLKTYLQLESILLSGDINDVLCQQYPELTGGSLGIQMKMFRDRYQYSNVREAQTIFQSMCPEVRMLFPEVEQLLRLLLVFPVTSCSAERSFSSLRRLKTWLRTTMLQPRLNAIAVCSVNQHLLDKINLEKLARDFACTSDIRRGIFGNWGDCDM